MSVIYAYRLEHISNGKGPWNFSLNPGDGEIFVGDLHFIQSRFSAVYIKFCNVGMAFEIATRSRLKVFHYDKCVTGFTSLDALFNYFFPEKDCEKLFGRAGFVIRKYQVNGIMRIDESSEQIAFRRNTASVIEECQV